jgi:hypothetical protein
MLSHPSHQEFPMTEAKPTSALRRRMIDDMTLRNLSPARSDEVQPSFRLPAGPARA